MVSFQKPTFTFNFDFSDEINNLKKLKRRRGVPDLSEDKLLIATWNIANLGLHKRADDHYRIIAEIISWFDIVAIQEVHDDLSGLYEIERYVGSKYELIFTDRSGNDERAAYFYNETKVERLQMVGELAVPPKDKRYIKIEGVQSKFTGFDRNPFIVSFKDKRSDKDFILINSHLYFGSTSKKNMERRALEAYAIGRYCDLRRDDAHSFSSNIIAVGDFNIPMAKKGDPIYEALVDRGLMIPKYATTEGTTISTMNQYDQVAFVPSLKRCIKQRGVFDYDKAIFPELWSSRESDFHSYCRYYISDHRPLWFTLDLSLKSN